MALHMSSGASTATSAAPRRRFERPIAKSPVATDANLVPDGGEQFSGQTRFREEHIAARIERPQAFRLPPPRGQHDDRLRSHLRIVSQPLDQFEAVDFARKTQ